MSNTIDEKVVTSNTLTFDILVHIEGETMPMIGSSIDFSETTEGELLTIPYIVYDPSSATCSVMLEIKNSLGDTYACYLELFLFNIAKRLASLDICTAIIMAKR